MIRQPVAMPDRHLSVCLPDPLFRAARDIAGRRGQPLERLIVDALNVEVARAFAMARDWRDLQDRLAADGAELREAGGGLALFCLRSGERLCKASDMGASLRQLSIRFCAPFPGPPPRAPVPDRVEEDIELFEPF
jgi:hypothetical protein